MVEKVKELGLPKETEEKLILFLANNTNFTEKQRLEFFELLKLIIK